MQKRVNKELEILREYAKNADIIKDIKMPNSSIVEMELRNTLHETENLIVIFDLPNNYPFRSFMVKIVNYKKFSHIHGSINPYNGVISDSTLVHIESIDPYEWHPSCSIKNWIEKYWSLVCKEIY